MQFKAFEPGIEVSGASLVAVVDGFRRYPSVARKHLVKHGLVKAEPGRQPQIDPTAWYPQDAWLATCEGIVNEVGVNSLYAVGKSIPANGVFPPHVTDIYSALALLDIAYHLNHRKHGDVMFNPETGKMLEGIGHYGHQALPDERKIICVCENPYPCDLDRGIITAMAMLFEPHARTVHDDSAPCRKTGADTCTYVVSW